MNPDFGGYLHEETHIRVCEEVGPNSPDYGYLYDKYMDDESWRAPLYEYWMRHIYPTWLPSDDSEGGLT